MKSLPLYQKAKDALRKEFIEYFYADEHDIYLDAPDIYWIGGNSILGIGDVFVGINDIVTCFKENIPCDVFLDWYWHSVENELDHRRINLESYFKMRGEGTHDALMDYLDEKEKERQTPEYKAKTEAELKKIWDDGIEKIKKYITK